MPMIAVLCPLQLQGHLWAIRSLFTHPCPGIYGTGEWGSTVPWIFKQASYQLLRCNICKLILEVNVPHSFIMFFNTFKNDVMMLINQRAAPDSCMARSISIAC